MTETEPKSKSSAQNTVAGSRLRDDGVQIGYFRTLSRRLNSGRKQRKSTCWFAEYRDVDFPGDQVILILGDRQIEKRLDSDRLHLQRVALDIDRFSAPFRVTGGIALPTPNVRGSVLLDQHLGRIARLNMRHRRRLFFRSLLNQLAVDTG